MDNWLVFMNNSKFTNMPSLWSYPPLVVHNQFIKLLNWDEVFKMIWRRFELGPLKANDIHLEKLSLECLIFLCYMLLVQTSTWN